MLMKREIGFAKPCKDQLLHAPPDEEVLWRSHLRPFDHKDQRLETFVTPAGGSTEVRCITKTLSRGKKS
jgi:hypothetical protein